MDIVLRQRGIAERMIESFMLVANETVAEHFAKLNLPFIYRIHEPRAESAEILSTTPLAQDSDIRAASSMSQRSSAGYGGDQKASLMRCLSMIPLRFIQQARYSEHNHETLWSGSGVLYAFHQSDSSLSDLLVHQMVGLCKSKEISRAFEQEIQRP